MAPPGTTITAALNDAPAYDAAGATTEAWEAYERAVQQCSERFIGLARRFLRHDEDARDTVQDALLSAFTRLDRFEERARLTTWMHRIVVNAALMKLRARRRRPEDLRADPLGELVEIGQHVAVDEATPESADIILERREARRIVRQCINSLPDTYRTVLLLRDIEELDTSETAQRLGVSAIVVRCRLHRAHRALRKLLEPHFAPEFARGLVPDLTPDRAPR
jgi:RNA polymerase sigma-70 factor (ECF subfamily)